MSEEGKFWVWTNITVSLLVVVLSALTTSYWKDHNTKIASMVADGVDPVAVMCAMQDDYGNMPVCLVLAASAK